MRQGLNQIQTPQEGTSNGQREQTFEVYSFLVDKMRWDPLKEEHVVIRTIEDRLNVFLDELFQPADDALEKFYQSIRVPEMEMTSLGKMIPKIDEDGRFVWDTNPDGSFKEDWTKLTGQEAEEAIWRLQRVISACETQVTRLFMRAQFAFYNWDEAYWEKYRAPVSGTQYDREAYARKETRDPRYFYLLQYWWWKTAKDRLDSIKQVRKDIEWALQRRLGARSERVYGE